jgi:hypothetical protein
MNIGFCCKMKANVRLQGLWLNRKVKVKVTPEQATKAQRGSIYSSTLALTSVLDGGR